MRKRFRVPYGFTRSASKIIVLPVPVIDSAELTPVGLEYMFVMTTGNLLQFFVL